MSPEPHIDTDLSGWEEEREARIEEIVAAYVDRLNHGEEVRSEDVLDAHPDIAADVIEHLQHFVDFGSQRELAGSRPLGTLGDYTLRREIGRGGMGVVYEAWENSMDRTVALKVLPAGIAADTRASVRFIREAQAAGRLSHQNVVPVYSTGVKEGIPWYSMEYIDGETLAQIFTVPGRGDSPAETPFGRRGEPPFYSNLAIAFAEVADGLEHAHSKGIVHRDVKPSNLILDPEGRLRILDFGLARLEGQGSLTLSGDFVGTPAYMSPEQAKRRKIPVDQRTDVYSLGATMYEVLTERRPFQGKDHADTVSQIIERDPVALRKVNPRTPRDLETITLKCLRKDPRDRYATAAALAEDLRCFARGDSIDARPQPEWEKLARRVWRWKGRAAVVVLIVSLVLLLLQSVLREDDPTFGRVWRTSGASFGGISDDGRYLAYTDWKTGDVAVFDMRKRIPRRLTSSNWNGAIGYVDDRPIVSPDGEWIVYTWWREGKVESGENEDGEKKRDTKGIFQLRMIDRQGLRKPQVVYEGWARAFDWSGKEILANIWIEYPKTYALARIFVDGTPPAPIREWNVADRVDANGIFVGSRSAVFSPHGDYVAYDWPTDEGNYDLFLIELDTLDETPLVVRQSDDRLLGWAPDDRILFSSGRTTPRSLYMIEVEEGRPHGKETSLKQEFLGAPVGFTEEGSFFYDGAASSSDVFVAALDPTGPELRDPKVIGASFVGSSHLGGWSRDGKFLAYRALYPGLLGRREWVLLIHSVESGEERILEPEPGFRPGTRLSGPRWSPDDEMLLVRGVGKELETGYGIYTIHVASGRMKRLATSEGRTAALWPSDGWVYFSPDHGKSIVRLRPEDGVQEVVYEGVNFGLTVSPDGQFLAFYRRSSNAWVVLPTAGGEPTELFRGQPGRILCWLPDGEHLLFSPGERQEVWRVNVHSKEQFPFSPSIPGLRGADVHPEGTRIAYEAYESPSELWVMKNVLGEAETRR